MKYLTSIALIVLLHSTVLSGARETYLEARGHHQNYEYDKALQKYYSHEVQYSSYFYPASVYIGSIFYKRGQFLVLNELAQYVLTKNPPSNIRKFMIHFLKESTPKNHYVAGYMGEKRYDQDSLRSSLTYIGLYYQYAKDRFALELQGEYDKVTLTDESTSSQFNLITHLGVSLNQDFGLRIGGGKIFASDDPNLGNVNFYTTSLNYYQYDSWLMKAQASFIQTSGAGVYQSITSTRLELSFKKKMGTFWLGLSQALNTMNAGSTAYPGQDSYSVTGIIAAYSNTKNTISIEYLHGQDLLPLRNNALSLINNMDEFQSYLQLSWGHQWSHNINTTLSYQYETTHNITSAGEETNAQSINLLIGTKF